MRSSVVSLGELIAVRTRILKIDLGVIEPFIVLDKNYMQS
jgi:hypothetical protein